MSETQWAILICSIVLVVYFSYLGAICKRAIEIDDPIIMCDLLNLGVLKPDNEDEAEAIRERAKEMKK